MKAKVVLINWTPNPIETMCWARRVMHAPVPDWLYDNLNLLKQLGRSILLENNEERVSEYLSLLTKIGLLGNVTS